MRPKGPADVLEDRRHRALTLLTRGLSLNAVARTLGCAASSVMRWRNAFRRRGHEALKVRAALGRPPRLSPAQQRRLLRVLLNGALANGYRTELWTTARIAEVIERTFGVRYHRDHVGRLMHKLEWSHQKPETRALERDEERILQWKPRQWPPIKNPPRSWAPNAPSSTNRFLRIPSVRKPWAPHGRTPLPHICHGRDKISVISGVVGAPPALRAGLPLADHPPP